MGTRWAIRLPSLIKKTCLVAGLLSSGPAFGVCTPSDEMLKALERGAVQHGLEPSLVVAIASVESCFGKYKHNSSTHDFGLMQINRRNLASVGLSEHEATHDNEKNLHAALTMLQRLKRQGLRRGVPWQCRYNIGNRTSVAALQACHVYLSKLKNAGWVGR